MRFIRPCAPGGRWRWLGAAIALGAVLLGMILPVATARAGAGSRVDLRVLVVVNGGTNASAIAAELGREGVPYSTLDLSSPTRPVIDAGFLADAIAHEGRFQAVVLPNQAGSGAFGLSAAELAALASYEQAYGVRQVDGYDYPGTVGLGAPVSAGTLDGGAGSVTAAGLAGPFAYSSGSFTVDDVDPAVSESYGYLVPAAPSLPVGASYTPLVTVSAGGFSGSVLGVYAHDSREELVITAAFNADQQWFELLGHGIVTWLTRGVHLGYDRNYLTFHLDDVFNYDPRWDMTTHCTPSEDCPPGVGNTQDIRMTAADVAHVVAWEQANGYTLTLPFNAYYSLNDSEGNPWNGTDGLTNALVANKNSFRWLSHGYEHIFQGCQQDFTVIPWVCKTTNGQPVAADGSNMLWVPQTDISNEIASNIARAQALGLPFDPTEYLSGEHSGLFHTPQQPVDNPNFGLALTQRGITSIGADASREPAQRQVGSALTVPRHPVAVYYNTATTAEEVSEYNWFYTTREQGGSGYCQDNPATTTCLASPLGANGFTDYIVPSDSAYDLHFILSNDPRPFYAHASNLTGPDYLGLTLLDAILGKYRAAFAANTPPVNLTLNQAADALRKQQAWAAQGMGANPTATGYVQDGKVTITNTGAAAAPVTVPEGTTVNGAAFGDSYAGERSGWIPGNAVLTVPGPTFTSANSTIFTVGTPGTFTVTTSGGASTPVITETGSLPAGVTLVDNGNGTATLAGTPATGTAGLYPLALRAEAGLGVGNQTFTLTVNDVPTAPTIGTATPGNASATVNWTPGANNQSPITGFTVRVYAGATNTVLNTLTAAGNATSLNVTGLTNGSTYSFDVAATNAVGIGLASARSTIVTPAAVPSAPTIGTVTAGSASATITWTAPASNGSAITGYTIRVYDGATTTVLNALSASAGTTSLNVTGLTNGAAYSFDVAATNAVGTGPASARSNVVTPASPSAVPTIGIATPGNASATVTWTPPTTSGSPITGYKIRVFVGASTTVLKALGASATATSLTVTGLTNGTSYTFDVAAITTAGTGAASARSAPVTPATAPGTPPIDTAVSGAAGGAITATAAWIPPSSTGGSPVTGYQVTALLMATTGEVLAQTVSPIQPATARSLEMTLPVAGNYRFTVQAINAMGAGAQSARSNLVAGR